MTFSELLLFVVVIVVVGLPLAGMNTGGSLLIHLSCFAFDRDRSLAELGADSLSPAGCSVVFSPGQKATEVYSPPPDKKRALSMLLLLLPLLLILVCGGMDLRRRLTPPSPCPPFLPSLCSRLLYRAGMLTYRHTRLLPPLLLPRTPLLSDLRVHSFRLYLLLPYMIAC